MSATQGRLTESERAQLDMLVPPPWPAGRRIVAVVAASTVIALAIGAVVTGAVGPRLSHANSSGSAVTGDLDASQLEASRLIILRNDGRFEVDLESLELPQIEGVTWREVQGLPATVAPGEEHQIELSFTTTSCTDIDVEGFNVFPVRAASGFLGSRTVEIAPTGIGHSTSRGTYISDDGTELTLPQWPEQPASWILDTVEPVCTSPPEGF